MNFNLGDPLADLLSNNNNDSFFKCLNSGSQKEGIPTKTTSKELIAQAVNRSANVETSTPRVSKNAEISIKGIDNGDVNLDLDPKKPRALHRGGDIVGEICETLDETRQFSDMSVLAVAEESVGGHEKLNMSFRSKRGTGRRGSGHLLMVKPDPLSLFFTNKQEKNFNDSVARKEAHKSKKPAITADWLGLSATSEQDTFVDENDALQSETLEIEKSVEVKSNENREIDRGNLKLLSEVNPDSPTLESVVHQSAPTVKNISFLNSMNIETQNAFHLLQQQEFQLALAAQMKKQEQALMEIRRKQESLLQQQEHQFNALFKKHIQRQEQLEEHIKIQQQRITGNNQLLMTHPSLVTLPLKPLETMEYGRIEGEVGLSESKTHQENIMENVLLEADIKRLELEKVRLEELVESLKGNYEKEVELIQKSFRNQVKILEENLVALETRFRNEIEEQQSFNNKKFNNFIEDKENMKSDYESRIASLKNDHYDEICKLRKYQEDNIEMIKEEHRHVLETIFQAKLFEFRTMQENGSYLEALQTASRGLVDASGDLQGLRDDIQTKIDLIHREREQKLDAREKHIENREKRLILSETGVEEEKRRLMELVSSLEVQLDRKTKDGEEEKWLLRQQMTSVEVERTALAREKVLMKEQFARDEKRIADLREQQMLDIQRQMLDIQDERNRLSIEQTKFETERRLQTPSDVEKQRMEIEATLKVAEKAARQADAERVRYLHMQRELEQKKRELVEKENLLRVKEDEFEQELQSIRLAERKSLDMQQKAREVEQTFQAKIQFLQQRLREMAEKESQLSQEQLFLAQERIKLQYLKTNTVDHKCSLCQSNERNNEMVKMLYTAEPNRPERVHSLAKAMGCSSGGGMTGMENIAGNERENCPNTIMSRENVVECLLDENIAESYRRMRQTMSNTDHWSDLVLDDDTKELALLNLDVDTQIKSAIDANSN